MWPTSTSDAPPPAASGAAPAPLARAAFLDLLVAALALVFANLLLVIPVYAFAVASAGGDPAAVDLDALTRAWFPQIAAATVFATLLAGASAWWLRARRMPRLLPAPATRAYAMAIGAGVLIQLVCTAVVFAADSGGVPIAPSNADPLAEVARQMPWLAWGLIVLVAPAAEELLFRHVLLRRFVVAGRTALGLGVTALVFAALHEPVPGEGGVGAWGAAVALYAAMSVGFGLVYARTGRLGAAIAAHAACNLSALLLDAFSTF